MKLPCKASTAVFVGATLLLAAALRAWQLNAVGFGGDEAVYCPASPHF